jgi:uncharacterized membrane protein
VSVYIPTTPVPSSGFLVIVPTKDITPMDMSVEEAMKIVISGGILSKEIFGPSFQSAEKPAAPERVTADEVT